MDRLSRMENRLELIIGVQLAKAVFGDPTKEIDLERDFVKQLTETDDVTMEHLAHIFKFFVLFLMGVISTTLKSIIATAFVRRGQIIISGMRKLAALCSRCTQLRKSWRKPEVSKERGMYEGADE